jgi:hypothetical protein
MRLTFGTLLLGKQVTEILSIVWCVCFVNCLGRIENKANGTLYKVCKPLEYYFLSICARLQNLILINSVYIEKNYLLLIR